MARLTEEHPQGVQLSSMLAIVSGQQYLIPLLLIEDWLGKVLAVFLL